MNDTDYDVTILGGGLAGLTLARQILQKRCETRILILEKRDFPVPEGAYKVGESTVEIGAHYLGQELALKKHLVDDQLPKFGLRFFFMHGQAALTEGTEVGTSEFFAAPGYQVDRGRLENYLAESITEWGATFVDRSRVKHVELGPTGQNHVVQFTRDDDVREVQTRWVVDASGRAGFLKKKLDLAQAIDHNVNAVWFRIGAELRIDQWCDDADWRLRAGRVPRRWLSTNHLLGKGYWVWIIPLASGATSVGIVADPRFHPLSELNQFPRALDWLERHEPMLAERIAPVQHELQDFSAIKRLGYSAKQLFSSDRWALTGEAGVFLDPLYSPGIDYIAVGNTMIRELVIQDLSGSPIDGLAPQLQSTFLTLFQNNLLTYEDQYALFGNPQIMSLKYVWDYAVYWSFPALLYFNEKLTDVTFIQSLAGGVQRIRDLNVRMQQFFRDWNETSSDDEMDAVFVDQHEIGLLTRLNAELKDRLDNSELRERFQQNAEMLGELSHEIMQRVCEMRPGLQLPEVMAPAGASRLEGVFELLGL